MSGVSQVSGLPEMGGTIPEAEPIEPAPIAFRDRYPLFEVNDFATSFATQIPGVSAFLAGFCCHLLLLRRCAFLG